MNRTKRNKLFELVTEISNLKAALDVMSSMNGRVPPHVMTEIREMIRESIAHCYADMLKLKEKK